MDIYPALKIFILENFGSTFEVFWIGGYPQKFIHENFHLKQTSGNSWNFISKYVTLQYYMNIHMKLLTLIAKSSNDVFFSSIPIIVPSENVGQKRFSSKLNRHLDRSRYFVLCIFRLFYKDKNAFIYNLKGK